MKAQLAFANRSFVGASPPLGADARSLARALTLAFGAHAVLIAAIAWGLEPVAPAPAAPMVRLVFFEPPPPPPPAAGGVLGQTGATAPEVVPLPERPATIAEVKRIEAPRKPLKAAKPQPPPRVEPRNAAAAPAVAPEPADVQLGSVAGAAGNVADGVVGGVSGGLPGGVLGGHGQRPIPAGQVAHPPTVISRVTPQYPRSARLEGIEGLVLLEAILDIDGRIEPDIKILSSLRDLDAAAIAALRRWRFKPARNEHGQTVPVILEVPIRFVMR